MNEQYLHLIRHAPAAIALLDKDLRYLAHSQRWLDDYHLQRDILGLCHSEIFPDISVDWREALRRAQAGESMVSGEGRFQREDGSTRWLRWEVASWRDTNHEIGGIVIFTEDITAQRQMEIELRASEQRLSGLIRTAMDGIMSIDEQHRICLINPAAQEMFGLSEDEALGQPMDRLIPHSVRDRHAGLIRQFAETGETSRRMGKLGVITGLRANGEEFPLEASISQTITPAGRQFTVIHRDVTEREQLAEAQKQAQRKIKEQKLELEEASRHFIAHQTATAIAHEINQPLAAIASYVTGALRLLDKGEEDRKTLNYALKKIEEQTQRAGETIHELMALLHKGEKPTEPLDIKSVVEEALDLIKTNGDQQTCQLRIDISRYIPLVLAHRLHILKVLINLITNARQATLGLPSGEAEITIAAQLTPDNSSMVKMTVRDNGKGLAEGNLQSLFQPFYTTKTAGLGMGLAVSRSLIEINGGKLWAEANHGPGLSFHFTLPSSQ